MRLGVNTEIAITYLSSRKKQTLIASLGVMFGISMFIFMQSLMKGTNDYFEKESFNSISHVHIYSENKIADTHLMDNFLKDKSIKTLANPKMVPQPQGIINPFGIIDAVRRDSEVVAVTPQVIANVLYNSGNVELSGIVVGVNIREQNKMFDIEADMIDGSLNDLERVNNGVVIGKGIATKLSLHVDDNITIVSAEGISQVMKVVGIYATSVMQTDNSKSYANISQVQSLLGKDRNYVTDIMINVKDYNNAPRVARRIESMTGYKAEDWIQANEQLRGAFKIRAVILNSVIGVILLVAGFGIYNILNMTIYEKIKEIAILKATGFSGGSVTSIFLQQAIFIGLMGAVVGIVVGFFLTLMVSKIYIGAGSLKYLPMSFYPAHYFQAVCFGVVTTLAAGFFPARKASKVDPVTIIRG